MNEKVQIRTGTVDPFTRADGSIYYRVRVRAQDGSRIRDPKPIPASHAATPELREKYAKAVQDREDEKGTLQRQRDKARRARMPVEAPKGATTLDAFRKKLAEKLEGEGRTSLQRPKSLWNARISPKLGKRPVAAITRDEIEDFRDYLDGEVRKRIALGAGHGLAGKSAMNIWSLLASTMKEAVSSRDRSMRLRTDNPCQGVKPPLRSPDRAKTFIWPTEFAALMKCTRVPLRWREAYAVGAYLYLRPNELRALTLSDVALDAGVVHITRAWDEESGKTKAPKTANGVREVPIPTALMPLLKAMHNRRKTDDDPIAPILAEENEDFRAPTLREHLKMAGVTRTRLTEDTATTQMVNFRSLRDSGITWLALAGVDLARIQRRAGHDDPKTTMGYVKQAEDFTGKVGTPFSPLPFPVFSGGGGGPSVGQVAAIKNETLETFREFQCEGRELNPSRNPTH